MKPAFSKFFVLVILLCLSCILFHQCTQDQQNTYRKIKEFADEVKVINTHEHQHWPEEYGDHTFGLFHLVNASYLMSDIVSAGGYSFDLDVLDSLSLEAVWDSLGEPLNYTRNTSYYSHFIKGFQKLYDFSELYFTKTNIPYLSSEIEKNYSDYRTWFDASFHKAGFELMFLDQYWKPFNTGIDEKYYALVFHINPLVMQVSSRPSAGDEFSEVYEEDLEDGGRVWEKQDTVWTEILECIQNFRQPNCPACKKGRLRFTGLVKDVPWEPG